MRLDTEQESALKKRSAALRSLRSGVERLASDHEHPVGFTDLSGRVPKQLPWICRTLDEAVGALESGKDPFGNPITEAQVDEGLGKLVEIVREPGYLTQMDMAFPGIAKPLSQYMDQLEMIIVGAPAWHSETGEELRVLAAHTNRVDTCAFSPDGRRIVSAGLDRTLKVWDAAAGAELRTLTGHIDAVNACAFSPDGTRIVSASDDGTLKIWDAENGAELVGLTGHTKAVVDCAFSPDGSRVLSASLDNTLKIWDADSGSMLKTFTGRAPIHKERTGPSLFIGAAGTRSFWFSGCAFSPDGTRIVSTSSDDILRVWDARSGAELWSGEVTLPNSCAFSPDGTRVVSTGGRITGSAMRIVGVLQVWDANSGMALATMNGHDAHLEDCSFSPDGTRIISASLDKTLRVWDADSGMELATLRHPAQVAACGFSPDGTRIISACWDKNVRVWGAETGPIIVTAAEREAGLVVRCPRCWQDHDLEADQLDSVITCPTSGCGLALRINPFVISRKKTRWWSRLRRRWQ
jgi:DNA-binding beta-propeller fold protein YncE